jgi:hypothetical protein
MSGLLDTEKLLGVSAEKRSFGLGNLGNASDANFTGLSHSRNLGNNKRAQSQTSSTLVDLNPPKKIVAGATLSINQPQMGRTGTGSSFKTPLQKRVRGDEGSSDEHKKVSNSCISDEAQRNNRNGKLHALVASSGSGSKLQKQSPTLRESSPNEVRQLERLKQLTNMFNGKSPAGTTSPGNRTQEGRQSPAGHHPATDTNGYNSGPVANVYGRKNNNSFNSGDNNCNYGFQDRSCNSNSREITANVSRRHTKSLELQPTSAGTGSSFRSASTYRGGNRAPSSSNASSSAYNTAYQIPTQRKSPRGKPAPREPEVVEILDDEDDEDEDYRGMVASSVEANRRTVGTAVHISPPSADDVYKLYQQGVPDFPRRDADTLRGCTGTVCTENTSLIAPVERIYLGVRRFESRDGPGELRIRVDSAVLHAFRLTLNSPQDGVSAPEPEEIPYAKIKKVM